MRLLIQRVKQARVTVEGSVSGQIGQGYLVFMGAAPADTPQIAEKLCDKMMRLRIFSDENDKINLALRDVGGSILMVSQFTLYADCRHGNRPGFTMAAPPQAAQVLYDYCIDYCRKSGFHVETGIFGADMQVSLCNDGPFTVLLDSAEMGLS